MGIIGSRVIYAPKRYQQRKKSESATRDQTGPSRSTPPRVGRFAIVLRVPRFPRRIPILCRGTLRAGAPPFERPRARKLALANVYTLMYIYPGSKSWPSLAYLSPGTAKL